MKNYIEILVKYKDSSLFLKSEKNVNYNSTDPTLLLEYYFNGHFINKDEIDNDFKDFIYHCMQIDPDKRKDSYFFLHHALFSKIKKTLNDRIDDSKYILMPLNKEQIYDLNTKFFYEDEIKFKIASSADNYEIFKNILKIDLITFLKKKGILNYKPKILDIPQYFSLFSPECDDYSISSEEEHTNTLRTRKQERCRSMELIYENDLNEKHFNEGCITLIGNYCVNLPVNYEKDLIILENFVKTIIQDQQFFKLNKSDKSSNSDQSVLSVMSLSKSASKILSSQNFERDKEINYYFKLKYIITNILFHTKIYKREDLIAEIKKMNYMVPSNLRKFVYQIILEVDYFNDIEELEISLLYENTNYIAKEMCQIKKDIQRCDEYDSFFKTDEGKYNLRSLFEGLLYNKDDFFYTQGMDSIASAFIILYYPNKEFTYQIFYKFIKKLLYIFYDLENKTIKSLAFHHLIIKRLVAFLDPELYLHLDAINFFEDQFAANWILTLFSRTFRLEILFKFWDILIVENINILYLFIAIILKDNRSYILKSNKETIVKDFNDYSDSVKIEPFINDVIKFYKFIPQGLLLISHSYDEKLNEELKNQEFYKNRWWEFENYYPDIGDDYSLPIITLDDTLKIYDKIIFVDIRIQLEYENLRIKDSFHLSLTKNKYLDATLSALDKNNGIKIFILIGNKNVKYKDYVQFLLVRKIRYMAILQGGIDIVYLDENSLIYKK